MCSTLRSGAVAGTTPTLPTLRSLAAHPGYKGLGKTAHSRPKVSAFQGQVGAEMPEIKWLQSCIIWG